MGIAYRKPISTLNILEVIIVLFIPDRITGSLAGPVRIRLIVFGRKTHSTFFLQFSILFDQ